MRLRRQLCAKPWRKLASSSGCNMMSDPHYNARGMFETVEIDGEPLKIPAILPKLSETPGRTDWPGAKIGAHNSEILGDLLGLSEADLSSLSDDGVTC